jgi:hypothetical protein
MPCSDGGPSPEQIRDQRSIPAMLCGLLTVLERSDNLDAVLDAMDWTEAGVSREWFDHWWPEHKREDAERRAWEAAERSRLAERRAALEKLSPAERAALGIRP